MWENLDYNKKVNNLSKEKKPLVDNKDLIFGHTFTDHMFTAEWSKEKGWDKLQIQPYQNLSLPPSAVVFHYALEVTI